MHHSVPCKIPNQQIPGMSNNSKVTLYCKTNNRSELVVCPGKGIFSELKLSSILIHTFWYNFRSMVIHNAKAGTILTIYNSGTGSKDDDFTVIKIRKDILDAVSYFG
jgi:hypothetical protein